jgi:rhodanese-related sulfurtransferase
MEHAMNVKSVSPATLKSWLDAGKAIVVDVRERREYAVEHIEGSELVPLSALSPEALPEHQGKKLVMLCRAGNRSMFACLKLNGAVSGEIYNLDGGIQRWKREGLPMRRLETSSGSEEGIPLAVKVMRFVSRFS